MRLIAGAVAMLASPSIAGSGAAPLERATQTIHVTPAGRGSDSDRLQLALAQARAWRASTGRGATIILAPGIYRLDRPLQIGANDSGAVDAPLRIVGGAGGPVVLTGNVIMAPSNAPQPLAALIPVTARRHIRAYALPPALARAFMTEAAGSFASKPAATAIWLTEGDIPLHLARWPDQGYVTQPIAAPQQAPVFPLVDITHDQALRWSREPALRADGFWTSNWAFEWSRVQAINPASNTATVARLPTHYSEHKSRRFRITNAFSEIDTPGEYAVDPRSGTLVVWPQSAAPVELAMVDDIVSVKGAHDVVFDGIAVRGSRGDAIDIDGANRVTFTNGYLGLVGSSAAAISGSSSNVSITRSAISDTGETGVRLDGGDQASLTRGGNTIRDSIVTRVGLRGTTVHAGVLVSGVGQTVAGCLITDVPKAAIAYRGNEHRFAGNEISLTSTDTGDSGALYTYADLTARGTVIEQNYFHDIRSHPGIAKNVVVYLDGWTSGITVRRNLFVNTSRAVFINGGSDNRIEDNIFVRPDGSPIFMLDLATKWNGPSSRYSKASLDQASATIIQRYGSALTRLAKAGGRPSNNVIGANLVIDGPASSFDPRIAALQEIAPQLTASGAGAGTASPIAIGRLSGAKRFGLDVAAMDRRGALAGLRYAGDADLTAAGTGRPR